MTAEQKKVEEPEMRLMSNMFNMLADRDIKNNGKVTQGTKELYELYNITIPLKYVSFL